MIDEIIQREWLFFDKVQHIDGRASCQDDFETFSLQRRSQFEVFDNKTLESYLQDLKDYEQIGLNPLTLKYAYMMASSDPEYFQTIQQQLPSVDEMSKQLIEMIVEIQVKMREEFNQQYPHLSALSRYTHTAHDQKDDVSFETYLRGELSTYSPHTLYCYGQMIVDMMNKGINMVTLIQEHTAKAYGFSSLKAAEDNS